MRIILVHGFKASPQMNFHPWLAGELRKAGYEVVTPILPLSDGENFDLTLVMEKMKEQVGYLKSDDILLGHSLGGLIALRYLESIEMTQTPHAMVLVGAPWKVSRPELRPLFMADLDADVLMWKAREFVIIHSKDDTLVPFEHGERLAEALKARLVVTTGDDHYMGERYPVLLEEINRLISIPHIFEPGEGLPDDFS
ncbi:TPA: hypothetical protein DEP34_04580 [Candidatus Uhrbacteria bacterium]|uniref:Esterase n=2 Tax=Candidatus Uhriibacteriota TaxID=1752732 RepID=A0A0G1SHX3_9BACT|nr:MAG: hypothetical protein UX45_C0007G0035 [Candidatus Uhrbacteria bacterium GW2011_GWF2_46_218]KKU41663.1 MAG: hypothetical protein UX57_C0002G0032 [Candidatus Uhrbacteria bacterium GW2011_GWE2_46_68]HBK33467.1 hypothetical protein [Candidatus Uhrbacteria bacterium]HCB19622.1 hypothetical protein [Candidatus Uhrbacteria bacterium]